LLTCEFFGIGSVIIAHAQNPDLTSPDLWKAANVPFLDANREIGVPGRTFGSGMH
jgi:hypothetical protein